jgi:hypothetical protein
MYRILFDSGELRDRGGGDYVEYMYAVGEHNLKRRIEAAR